MPLLIDCPSGHRLKVPLKRAGHQVRCPICDMRVAVPPLPRPLKRSAPAVVRRPVQIRQQRSIDRLLTRQTEDDQSGPEEPACAAINSPETVSTSPSAPALSNSVGPPLEIHTEPAISESSQLESVVVVEEDDASNSALAGPRISIRDDDSESPKPVIDLGIDTTTSSSTFSARGDIRATIQQAGYHYGRERYWSVVWLGVAALGLAALCAMPPLLDQVASWQSKVIRPADTWTYLVLLVALIQAAVAIYAMQIPDWSTSWVVSLVTTASAAMYALGLALTMFADQEHRLVKSLGLLDEAFHHTAQIWCFLVMCVTLILAYSYGQFSLRWYRLEQRLRETRS